MLKFKQFINEVLNFDDSILTESDEFIQSTLEKYFDSLSSDTKNKMIELSKDYIKSCGYDLESLIKSEDSSNVLTISLTVTKIRINGYSFDPLTFDTDLRKIKVVGQKLQEKIEKNIPKLSKGEMGLCVIYSCLSINPQFVQYGTKNTLSVEEFQIEDINKKIKEVKSKKGILRIKLDGRFVNEGNGPLIVEAVSAKKSESKIGKSDVDLIIEIGQENKVIYISLKDRRAGDGPGQGFRQFGGLKGKTDYPSLKRFSELLKQKLGRNYLNSSKVDPGKGAFAVPIPESDRELALKSIFGMDASLNNHIFSPENLHMVVEGRLIFQEDEEGFFHIKPDKNSEIIYNPSMGFDEGPEINSKSPYWPCIYVGYSSDKSLGSSLGWNHARFGFWTINNKETQRAIKNAEALGITADSIR